MINRRIFEWPKRAAQTNQKCSQNVENTISEVEIIKIFRCSMSPRYVSRSVQKSISRQGAVQWLTDRLHIQQDNDDAREAFLFSADTYPLLD